MLARLKVWLVVLGGLSLFAFAGAAAAASCNCKPPTGCCTAPKPPTPPTQCCRPPTTPTGCSHCGGGGGGTTVIVPGVNVNVGATVVVNAQSSANVFSSASGYSGSTVYYGGGGGGGGYIDSGSSSYVQNLNVVGGSGGVSRTAFENRRTVTRRVIIQAVCLDDKAIPHPASQVGPDRDIADAFEGEIFRCIAGTRMQATIANYQGALDFSHGETMACDKMQALYHAAGGQVSCRAQIPARDCNERSLLRRFGAGIKILTMTKVETFTDYREEHTETASAAGSLMLDGGVGGFVH